MYKDKKLDFKPIDLVKKLDSKPISLAKKKLVERKCGQGISCSTGRPQYTHYYVY